MGVSAHPIPAEADALIGRLPRLPWPAEVEVGECVLEPRGRQPVPGRLSSEGGAARGIRPMSTRRPLSDG
jgi:hypothetical protein